MRPKHFLAGLAFTLAAAQSPAQTTLPAAPPAGRLLASNCFQCHGTNGTGGVERIAGKSAGEVFKDLKEMQRKTPPKMMDMHARGYTDEQLRAIATYLSTQR